MNPIDCSKAGAAKSLCVRIDEKLGRIKNRGVNDTEDTLMDLMGYLVLLEIAIDREKQGYVFQPSNEGKVYCKSSILEFGELLSYLLIDSWLEVVMYHRLLTSLCRDTLYPNIVHAASICRNFNLGAYYFYDLSLHVVSYSVFLCDRGLNTQHVDKSHVITITVESNCSISDPGVIGLPNLPTVRESPL